MRLLRLFLIGFVLIGLITGIVFNNLWRFMTEFNTLDAIFSTPVYFQTLLLVLCISMGWFFHKKASTSFGLGFLVFTLLVVLSWHKVVVSNGVNSITTELYPFYRSVIKFDAIKRIKKDGRRLTILTTSEATTLHTGIQPLGPDTTAIWGTLLKQGICLNKIDGQCTEIQFVSP